eukprot:TRINITY_DN104526_c0_g1_i1.p1 TRINITY_DN104526_c0_g1~~TRINITY_DN104526_c0_g1_i1.p1  ORF type:complete len:249 (+),score=24.60 TRINITY_DN104526_c0_g1_i1:45-791(+)
MAGLQRMQTAAIECESDSGEESTGGAELRQASAASLLQRNASKSASSLNLSCSSDGTVSRAASYLGLSDADSDLSRSFSSLSTFDLSSVSVHEQLRPARELPGLPEIKVASGDLSQSRTHRSPTECPSPVAEATPQIPAVSHGQVRASRGVLRLALPMRLSPATSRTSSNASGGRAPRNNQTIIGDVRRANLEAGDATWDIQTPRLGGPFVDRLSIASTSSANSVDSCSTPTSCASPCPETSAWPAGW